ncbi:MAG: NAD-binding protein [Victivallales bacterium]|nr:NAD-binding protein [Victivallales bacterium]
MEMESYQLQQAKIKVRLCLVLIIGVILAGTFGYRLIEEWGWIDCIYMTVTTLSTVGYSEVHPLSFWGRIFTVSLIIGGVGTLAFGMAGMVEVIFHNQMMMAATKYRTKRMLAKMKDHIIICGGGKMGEAVLMQLLQEDIADVVMIENDAVRAAALEEHKVPVIQGDAREERTLRQAAIERAVALVAVLGNDADNLFLVLTAREMNPDLKIIARSEMAANQHKFIQAGATQTVSPFLAGARRISTLLVAPDIASLAEVIGNEDNVRFRVEKLEIIAGDPFDGQSIAQAGLRETLGGLVVAIKKVNGKTIFNPSARAIMAAGDVLYVIKFSERRPNNHQ